jgi:hypothetical protein
MSTNDEEGADHARRILQRNHYRVAFQTVEHPSDGQLRRWNNNLMPEVLERYGGLVAFDNAEKAPHRFDRGIRDFPVIKHSAAPPSSIEEESKLIEKLEEIRVRRIFAPKEHCEEIGSFCESLNLNVGRRPAE